MSALCPGSAGEMKLQFGGEHKHPGWELLIKNIRESCSGRRAIRYQFDICDVRGEAWTT